MNTSVYIRKNLKGALLLASITFASVASASIDNTETVSNSDKLLIAEHADSPINTIDPDNRLQVRFYISNGQSCKYDDEHELIFGKLKQGHSMIGAANTKYLCVKAFYDRANRNWSAGPIATGGGKKLCLYLPEGNAHTPTAYVTYNAPC